MAAAAGTALFRSMARKMAPHRVIAARGLHGGTSSGVGRSSPSPRRLSTSSGNEDLAARDHHVLGQVRADPEFMPSTMDQIKATTNTCLVVLVFGTSLFYTFVKPKLNKLEDTVDALSREVVKLKQEIIKQQNIKDEGHKA